MTEQPGSAASVAGATAELTPAQLAAAHGLDITGRRPTLTSYTRELWSRRHFVVAYATAKLTALYTTAKLGQLWQVVTPLLNALVYYLVFGLLLGTNRGIPNFIAYLCTGVFVFQFTQSAVLSGTRAIADNLTLIRALHFPRACLPIAGTLIQLQQLAIAMLVLVVIVLCTGEPISWYWLLCLPALGLQTLFNGGLALVMARLGARTTDLAQLMPFVIRTWMYTSGVFWSVDALTKSTPGWVQAALQANPALVYISLVRWALIRSTPQLPPHAWPLALGWALLLGCGGYVWFWRAEDRYGRG
ncbi:ABC transporter permease [Streptacidiphilus monticola]|uniref:Transport permease protein n=1 Tax=Streptacidiphilus monticola TaxID=2161674 RepID=A0ABW1G4G3_9ACTN